MLRLAGNAEVSLLLAAIFTSGKSKAALNIDTGLARPTVSVIRLQIVTAKTGDDSRNREAGRTRIVAPRDGAWTPEQADSR